MVIFVNMVIPEGFRDMMIRLLGDDEAHALFEALERKPATGVRFNRRKIGRRAPWASDGRPVAWCSEGLRLAERPGFTFDPRLHAGQYYVQDPSSMIAEWIVAQLAGDAPIKYLDLCAAPGGKTTAAINALPDGSVVVANEYDRRRSKILRENLTKWGYANVIATQTDAATLGRLAGEFDIVAVDAPCSGEGMMRKESEAANQWSERLVRSCAALQRQIVADILPALKPGGYLIYSTCTFNSEEDERNAEWIADELGLENVKLPSEQFAEIAPGAGTKLHCMRFMPHLTEGEGLFAAVFRKPGDSAVASVTRGRRKERARRDAKRTKPLSRPEWVRGEDEVVFREKEGTVSAILAEAEPLVLRIETLTDPIMTGVEVAVAKGRDYVPAHGVVLSDLFRRGSLPEVELTESDAQAYLRREAISLPEGTPRGMVVATFEGLPLGLLNNLGNRSNNLYPAEWRVRSAIPGKE